MSPATPTKKAVIRGIWFVQALLLIFGLAAVAKPVYHKIKRIWVRQEATACWEARNRASAPAIRSGDPIAWLRCPTIGLDTPILFDASRKNLVALPCLSSRGVLPGERGTLLIQAHRDAHFSRLGRILPGDTVLLEDFHGRTHSFRAVETEIIAMQDLEERFNGSFEGMVLITCHPFDFAGPAPDRYLVWLREEPTLS
jgi:sortase A